MFLSLAINKIISNLFLKEYLGLGEGSEHYNHLCKYFEKNFKKINKNLKALLNLFFKKNDFEKILKPKYIEQTKDKNIKGEPYESLLYGLRFCTKSLLKINKDKKNEKQKYLFSSILSDECFKMIKENFIPGNNAQKNKKLESFKLLKKCINDSPNDIGFYICDCGCFYSLVLSDILNEKYESKCRNCKLPIGSEENISKDKNNNNSCYYRIFKSEAQMKEQLLKEIKSYENIKNKTFSQYKEEIIEPLLNSSNKGITKIAKEEFLDNNITKRNISEITYRILNFILFNHLFYANCLKYIKDEELKNNFLIENMNCVEIIQSNWNILEEALKERNISSTQAFLNLIFKDLSELISNCGMIKTEKELNEFENKAEQIVESSIVKYPEFYEKYLKICAKELLINEGDDRINDEDLDQKLISIYTNYLRVILNESFPPSDLEYPESEYPFLKFFMYTEYKTNFYEALKKDEEYMSNSKYPLIEKYINHQEEQEIIKYLPKFNDFANYMEETYSYHIKRKKAKEVSLSSVNEYNEKKFNDFKESWDKIYEYATKYKYNELEPKKLTKNDKLIFFLNDNNETEGMYIPAAYQKFITYQNEFLLPIIESTRFNNGILDYYMENMQHKIPVQEANNNQILSIDDCFKNSNYKNFNDLVYTYTKRDIYDKNRINYRNYNKFKYDFAKIEEELGKLLLPEKCLFEDPDKLNFVIFLGEGFKDGQSKIFQNFNNKYPQMDLNEEEKKKISSDIQKIYDEDTDIFMEFFGSMQLLLFYLSNNVFIQDKDLKSIMEEKPNYLKLNEKCVKFFINNDFKINQFMSIFFYIEHLIFEELSTNLQAEYKEEINPETVNNIKEQLNKREENEIISWKELAAAVRRFISRYLMIEKKNSDVKENNMLKRHLIGKDLWRKNFTNITNLEELINEKINKFNITVKQAFKFYEMIGEKDKNSITPIKKETKTENPDDEQNGANNDSDDDNYNNNNEEPGLLD